MRGDSDFFDPHPRELKAAIEMLQSRVLVLEQERINSRLHILGGNGGPGTFQGTGGGSGATHPGQVASVVVNGTTGEVIARGPHWIKVNPGVRPDDGKCYLGGRWIGSLWVWSMYGSTNQYYWENTICTSGHADRITHWAPVPEWMADGPVRDISI